MPDKPSQIDYHALLCARLSALERLENTNAESRDTVVLDQCSVGRLSRMDALQQQAMAKATQQNRQGEIRAIHAALERLENGEYGYCDDCGEEIPPKRLQLSPTARRCVSCASGQ